MVLLSLLFVVSAVQTATTGPNTNDQSTFQRLETEWNRAHLHGVPRCWTAYVVTTR